MMNKKGALELSINAIVIVILAMTLLGLGLGFVRGMFGKITDITDDTFDKLSEDLMQRITSSDAEVIFSQTNLKIDRRSESTQGLAIKNDDDVQIDYGIRFTAFSCPEKETNPGATCPDISTWFNYFNGDSQYKLKAADAAVNKIKIIIPNGVKTGLYLVKVAAYEGSYADPCVNYDPNTGNGCSTLGQTELFLTVT